MYNLFSLDPCVKFSRSSYSARENLGHYPIQLSLSNPTTVDATITITHSSLHSQGKLCVVNVHKYAF